MKRARAVDRATLTYRNADGWEIPFLVASSGGHPAVERLFATCDGPDETPKSVPSDAVLPSDFTLPNGESVQVIAYNHQSFGFLRLTIGLGRIEGEFFAATPQALARADSFCLDVAAHRILVM
jgi:hypothetical protein